MLAVTELSEAMEAYRKINFSFDWYTSAAKHPLDKSYKEVDHFKEELADTAIRLFDLCGSLGIDLEKEISKKMKVNEGRPIKHGKNC